jgi:hypothetical protein
LTEKSDSKNGVYKIQQSIESPGVGDSFSFKKESTISHSHPPLVLVSSHATQQHRLTTGVCWKELAQGAGVLTI